MWKIQNQTSTPKDQYIQTARTALAQLRERKDLGFMRLPEISPELEARAKEIQSQAKHLIVLGIGGSALGARAMLQALHVEKPKMSVRIIDNVDSYRFWHELENLNLADCHWLLISKSGNTIETLTQAEFVNQVLIEKNLKPLAQVSTVVSEKQMNPLTKWAEKNHVPVLELPKDVGGRFSVLSAVGLLPAACYGVSLKQLQEGSEWVKKQDALICEIVAQTLASFERGEWITLFWSYCDRLQLFGFWLQQLWAESLAKKLDRTGKPAARASTPMSAIGTTDQHSILQQVMEGTHDKLVVFLRVGDSETQGPRLKANLFEKQELMLNKTMGELFFAQAEATREALKSAQVQSISLRTEKLEASDLGALFMLFQFVIGTLGEAMNINAFDQPGVEAGKIITRQMLSQK